MPLAGTPFDFRQGKPVGQDIEAKDRLLQKCGGYDHNFTLPGTGLRKIAELYDPKSGRVMERNRPAWCAALYRQRCDAGHAVPGRVEPIRIKRSALRHSFIRIPQTIRRSRFPS